MSNINAGLYAKEESMISIGVSDIRKLGYVANDFAAFRHEDRPAEEIILDLLEISDMDDAPSVLDIFDTLDIAHETELLETVKSVRWLRLFYSIYLNC